MKRSKFKLDKNYLYLLLFFVLSSTICLGFKMKEYDARVNFDVIEGGNVLIFILSMISCRMHLKAATSKDANAFVRSIQGSMLLKLFILGAAAFIYVYLAGAKRNAPAIFICMGLYVIYSIIEVRGAYVLIGKKNEEKNRTSA